jgi:hypothetical protein
VTTKVTVANTALGECTCDITANACDAYCCCDKDCDDKIRQQWNADYDNICAKNYIGSAYKPLERCIDRKHISGWNKRMGMEISETETRLCVEMDTGSGDSEYKDFIKSFDGTPQALKYDMR